MPTFGPKTLICEGYDPANSLDLVYAKRDGKAFLFSGTAESLHESERGCQIVESLADVGIVPPVSEAAADDKWTVDPKTLFVVEGVFQRWGTKNANGRTYPRELFEGIVGDPKSSPMQAIAERRMTGHLEHPGDGRSNIKEYAILTTDLKLVPNKADGGKSGIVRGRAELLETPNGAILRTLSKHRIPWGVSSRGTGSVDESGNVKWSGKNEDDDFKLITFDAVDNPSTPGARNFTPAGQVKEASMSSPAEAEKHRVAKDKLPLQSYAKLTHARPDGSPICAKCAAATPDAVDNTGAVPSADATCAICGIPGDPQEPFSRGVDRDKAYSKPKNEDALSEGAAEHLRDAIAASHPSGAASASLYMGQLRQHLSNSNHHISALKNVRVAHDEEEGNHIIYIRAHAKLHDAAAQGHTVGEWKPMRFKINANKGAVTSTVKEDMPVVSDAALYGEPGIDESSLYGEADLAETTRRVEYADGRAVGFRGESKAWERDIPKSEFNAAVNHARKHAGNGDQSSHHFHAILFNTLDPFANEHMYDIPGYDDWKADDHDRYDEGPWHNDDEDKYVHPFKGIKAGHHVYVEHPDIPGGYSRGIVIHRSRPGDHIEWVTVQSHKGPEVDVEAHSDNDGRFHLDKGHYIERSKRKHHEPTESAEPTVSSPRILSWVTESAEQLDEKGIARLFKHMDANPSGYVILTGHRGERSKKENEAHNAALEAHLRKHGYGYHKVDGAYVENKGTPQERVVREKSFFIPDVNRQQADLLAKHAHEHHQQESILHGHGKDGAHFVYGKTGSWEKIGDQAMALDGEKAHEYYTQYHNRKDKEGHKFKMAPKHRRYIESIVRDLSSVEPGSVDADETIDEAQSLIADRETANEDRAVLRQALAEFAAKAVSPMLKPSPTKFPSALPKQKAAKQKKPAVVGMGVGESASEAPLKAPSRYLLDKLLASKIYHKTGWDVSRHLADSAEKAGFNREHVDSDHDFSVPYEATVTKHFHVGHKTGTRAIIYRMPSGTYELTAHHVQHDDESTDEASMPPRGENWRSARASAASGARRVRDRQRVDGTPRNNDFPRAALDNTKLVNSKRRANESLDEAGSVGTLSRDLISLRGTSDTTIPLMILQYLGGAAFTERNQVYGYAGTVDGLEFKLAYPSGVQSPSDIPTVDCAITMDNKGTYAVRVGKRAKTRVNAENLKATFAALSGRADPSIRTPQRASTYAPESVDGDNLDAIYEGDQVPTMSAPDLAEENRKLARMLDSAKGALVKLSQSVTEDARASAVNETGGTGMPRTVAGGRQSAGDEKSASRKMLPKTVTESAPMPATATVAINEEAPRSVQIFRSMRAGASA